MAWVKHLMQFGRSVPKKNAVKRAEKEGWFGFHPAAYDGHAELVTSVEMRRVKVLKGPGEDDVEVVKEVVHSRAPVPGETCKQWAWVRWDSAD